MAAPSKEELIILGKFRAAIQAEGIELTEWQQNDMGLVAWLRARDLIIPKSLVMLKKSSIWRKEEDIANILTWKPPESYSNMFPYELCGHCKDGSSILVAPFGKWDVRKTVEAGNKKEWLRLFDLMFADAYEDLRKTNESRTSGELPLSQIVIIVDFEGFGFRQLTLKQSVQTILECVSRFEGNYPEMLKALYLINAPRVFSILFSIIKPVMSTRTLSKVEIFNYNQNKWKPALLTQISPDELPTALGGTNPDSCKFFSKEWDYTTDSKSQINGNGNNDEMVTTSIPPGQDFKLEYDVSKKNTVLDWNFKINSYDIGFSIVYNTDTEVLPHKKCDSNLSKHNGFLNCEKLGTYTLIFDNKYSQFRGKTVHYTVNLNEPEDE